MTRPMLLCYKGVTSEHSQPYITLLDKHTKPRAPHASIIILYLLLMHTAFVASNYFVQLNNSMISIGELLHELFSNRD